MPIDLSHPTEGIDYLFKGGEHAQNMINSMLHNRQQQQMTPYQIELLRAQAQEASGKASESSMMNSFMQSVLGVNPSDQSNQYNPNNQGNNQGNQQNNNNNQNYSNYNEKSDQLFTTKNSQQNKNFDKLKQVLEMRGKIVPTAKEKAALDVETGFNKALSEHDAKKIGELEDIESNWVQSEPSYQEAAEIVSDPEWRNMRDSTLFPNAQLQYYKLNGTEKQIKMITDLESKTNQFIMNSIHKFPQRFTDRDLNYLKTLKINENDSIGAAQSKLSAAYKYDKIISERAGRAAEIAREQRIPVNKAIKLANEEMDIQKIRDDIDEQIKTKPKNKEFGLPKKENGQKVNKKITQDQITAENIMGTAKELKISVPEVIKLLIDQGYNIPEGPMK